MIRFLLSCFALIFCLLISWELWQNPDIIENVKEYVENRSVWVMEVHHSSDQIMNINKNELLYEKNASFKDCQTLFYPYLLMEIKYIDSYNVIKEAMLFWSLTEGEMVLDTTTWEQTRGFADAIRTYATAPDYDLLFTLSKARGSLPLEKLKKELGLSIEDLDKRLASVVRKRLVVRRADIAYLYFDRPKFTYTPETKMTPHLTLKLSSNIKRMPRNFSKGQIERAVKSAFGDEVVIRSSKEVFLPVYCIEVQKQTGTHLSTFWNSISGKRVLEKA